MGQTLTQIKQQVTPDSETFLLKYFPQFQFFKMLSDSIFLKSAVCINETEGYPIVCKIYFKKEINPKEKDSYSRHIESLKEIQITYTPSKSPNVAPILMIDNNLEKAGIMIRQYFAYNLKEKMACMPYLTKIEKKWISFQILNGLYQIHNKGKCHGNIKLENILLSSNSSVFLCDMAPYKPAYIHEDDVGSFTYYFGGSSNVNSCYLAPERLVDRNLSNYIYDLTTSMDIFAAAVVIAELFLDDILFDHEKLLLYKYGKYDLKTTLNKIKDEKLESLLLKMLTIDPKKRINIEECLKIYADEISPVSFSRIFIHINTLMINSSYWKPDKRIGIIKIYWKQIWKSIFGNKENPPELNQYLNYYIENKILFDDPFTKFSAPDSLYPSIFHLDIEEKEQEKFCQIQNKESAFILINFILSAFLNTKYSSSKLCAIEMLKHISDNLPYDKDLIKIQIIMPYLLKLLKDSSNLIRFSGLHEIINTLKNIDIENLILPSSDYNVFDAYVFDYLRELFNSKEPFLILAFSNLIEKITDLQTKFLQVAMRSRYINMKDLPKDNLPQINKSVFGFNRNTSQNLSKGEIIIQKYDKDLNEFKININKIIEDILSKTEDIDIQRMLIRKLPDLMLFFGRREISNFIKYIHANFSKRCWIIQREIFKSLPSLIIPLGEQAFNDFILPCMDLVISNNLNELKIYEMIKSFHALLKMNYIDTFIGIDLFKQILPFIIHPNLCIRNEVISFASTLIGLLKVGEIYTFLRPDLKNYISIPFLLISSDLLKNSIKDRLSRVIYELSVRGIIHIFQPNLEDKDGLQLLEFNIKNGRAGQMGNYDDNERNQVNLQFSQLKNVLEGISLATVLRKEFSKWLKIFDSNDEINPLEKKFLGKVISLSWSADIFQIPQIRNRRNSINANNRNIESNLDNVLKEGMLDLNYFKIQYILKSLDIVLKVDNFIDEENKNFSSKNPKYSGNSLNNIQKNSNNLSMGSWRPSGRLISTFYDHENSTIEKLISLYGENSNKIVSVGGDGKLILYDIYDSETNIFVDKIAEEKAEYIQYNKAITAIDNNSFAIGYKNKINIYKIENFNSANSISQSYTLPEENDNISITNLSCYLRNTDNNGNKTLVYTNQKGKIYIYDLRCSKKVLSNNFGVCRGLFSSMDWGKDDKSMFISTYGGFILNYDLRLNHIVESFKMYDNIPIINLKTFIPSKLKEFEANLNYFNSTNPNNLSTNTNNLSSQNLYNTNSFNSNYVIISTGSGEHDLSLWNLNSQTCEFLFKTNTINGNENIPSIVEIPKISKITNLDFNKENYDLIYKNLTKLYTHRSLNNKIIESIDSDFYLQSNKRLSKINNIYSNYSSVQVINCPFNSKLGDSQNISNLKDNVPFIISAGNDMSIRYWDLRKDKTQNKSYVINCPNKVCEVNYKSIIFDRTNIIQCDEYINIPGPKKNCPYFSEFQNKNGIGYHAAIQNEFVENSGDFLQYCTSLSDASHKDFITDLQIMNLQRSEKVVMFSSSWDGTMKVWR